MKDDKDKLGQAGKNAREARLKLALRENLKRRKSQARGRSDTAGASSGHDGGPLDDAGDKKSG